MDYDVVVVGAGPAGCLAAKYAAKNGAKTLHIEEHASIGSPVQCAGLLSASAIPASLVSCSVESRSAYHRERQPMVCCLRRCCADCILR